jgi:hypothetical protein
LEPGDEEDEVGYRLGGWPDRDRGRLIEYLNALGIVHRFEEEELVVAAEDEERVDDLIAELMATASDDQGSDEDDYGEDLDELEGPFGSGRGGAGSGGEDSDTADAVALLRDAARRLRADPTDMQADADVAEASTAVFLADDFYGVDADTWAAVGRVTRRLLTALGAEEALEEEIRLQAGVLDTLLRSVPLSSPATTSTASSPTASTSPSASPSPASPDTAVPSGGGGTYGGAVPGAPADSGVRAARLAVGTVYELTEWMPEQRAHLSVLLDDNSIVHEWDGDDLVVDSSRETEAEALFSLVGGVEPGEDEDDDEDRYHAIEELFNASGRLASDPEDPQRRADALDWAEQVDGPAPVGMDEVFWLRVIKTIHALTSALDDDEDLDAVAAEATTLHDLLRTVV